MIASSSSAAAADDLRQRFERDGYVTVPEVIDRALVEEGREHVAWLMRMNPGVRPEHLGHTLVANDPFWVRLISDPRLLDIAERFIGPNIALFASHYIAKPPREGLPVLWHQDGSYWPLEPMEVVTLWLALDDVDAGNGCMRVIPGTHRDEMKARTYDPGFATVLGDGIDPALLDEASAVDVVLPAGGVSIHHPSLVHGSNANTSERWRRGLTIRYIPTTTRTTDGRSGFLLRGKAVAGINSYHPRPRWIAGEHLVFRGCAEWNALPPMGG